MTMPEVLQWADNIVFTQTGKHLDDLQQIILQGTLQGKGYSQIADEYDYAEGYVRDAGAELWKLFSKVIGEDVKKSNVRTTLERASFSIISSDFSYQNNNLNFCGNDSTTSKPRKSNKNRYFDLNDAPTSKLFYGRTQELNTLESWIIQKKNRLIAISGISGIGKTALTLQLIENIKHKFDYVIWRNLSYFSSLKNLLEDLIAVFGKEDNKDICTKTPQRTIIKYLRDYRCLIIFDNVQILCAKGKLAGEYLCEYQDYGEFFKQLGDVKHQSSIILNCWEISAEIQSLVEDNTDTRFLHLKGLGEDAKAILREKELQDEDIWDELINIYGGNPQWLKLVAIMIQELSGGKISQFWQYQKVLLPDNLITIINQQIQRLSPLEQQIIIYLSEAENSLTLCQIINHFQYPFTEVFNAIQSLTKRFLIEKINTPETQFMLIPVIKEYCLCLSQK